MKTLIVNQFTVVKALFFGCGFSMLLLALRIKMTHELYYLFLVWNLFLALIPLLIVWAMASAKQLNTMGLLIGFCFWLVFLPNAPYVITDLIHIKYSPNYLLVYDSLMILSFALVCLYSGFVSITELRKLCQSRISSQWMNRLTFVLLLLCGFGIYLGRVLRYNSWDILSDPLALVVDIGHLLVHPVSNWHAWLFTLLFGTFLNLAYFLCQPFYTKSSNG